MSRQLIKQVIRAGLFGAIAGSRSMLPLALLTRDDAKHRNTDNALEDAAEQAKSISVQLLAAGEFIGDKLPFTPNRTDAPSVVFRSVIGAVAATMYFGPTRKGREYAAVLGLLGALGSTYALFNIRKLLTTKTIVPDGLIATGEDSAAMALGLKLLEARVL